MLTKWGSALGLASAGRIVSLAGGGPLGVATIWGPVGIWADLSTIPAGDIRNGDEVPVNGLGTSHSSGIAQRHGSEWRLIEGKWDNVADMLAWNTTPGNVVHSGAFAQVKSSGGHNDDSVTYIYQSGNWVRFAGLTAGYAWALSSMQDFSAIGLQDGDFGIFTPSGGSPITLRYKAACPLATVGGGTVPIWLPPVVYAGNPEIKSYLIGTEDNIALGTKGWTVSTVPPGTVSTVGGYIRLDGPTGSATQGAITAATITGSAKFYMVGEFRGSAGGSNPFVGIFSTIANPVQYALARGSSSGVLRQFIFSGGAWTIADTLSQVSRGGLNFPAVTPYLVQALSSDNIAELVESRIDGELYSSLRRNFNGANDASSYAMQILASGGTSGTVSRLEIRNLYYMTY